MSVVLFAYHDVGCLGVRTLARLGIDIAAVYTHEDDPGENTWFASVRAVCEELGIPVHAGVDPHAPEEMEKIRALKPAAFFSFYYRNLLRDELLAIPKHGGVNLHGSLLPRYRGRAPVNWQLLHGERQGGVTLHYMVKKADAGDVVDQEPFEIGPDDRPTDVFAKILPAAERVLERSARAVVDGVAPRAHQVPSKATLFGRRGPADGLIDWHQAADDVRNLVRAVTDPYPGAFTFAGDRKVLVWWAEHEAGAPRSGAKPGMLEHADGAVFVTCGDLRRLRLTEIEVDGRRVEGGVLAKLLQPGLQLTSEALERV